MHKHLIFILMIINFIEKGKHFSFNLFIIIFVDKVFFFFQFIFQDFKFIFN